MLQFDVPIAVFMFKRAEKTAQIIDQIGKIRPRRLYLIGDGPRTEEERPQVEQCRSIVETHITWDCQLVKYYAERNRGVYDNIAGGAKWVLEREPFAIFLEDDNFPALSFFPYCEELLKKYKDDTRILWICGTNYLKEYVPLDGSDYVFTQLMLPCGWASWSHKFAKFYDGNLDLYKDEYLRKRVAKSYRNKALLRQNISSWNMEYERIKKGLKPISWDFQMAYTLRVHNLLGIAPKYNQITNIGADEFTTHGGDSMKKEMSRRFCELPSIEMPTPLTHPKACLVDLTFERLSEKIIILPLSTRLKVRFGPFIKKLLGIPTDVSIIKTLKNRFSRG